MTETLASKAKSIRVAALIMLLVFFPLAVLGLLASPNTYQAMGEDGVDCDGPLGVLLYAAPALATYLPGSIFLARLAFVGRKASDIVGAVVCVVVSFGLAANVTRSIGQHFSAQHQEVCGAGL